MLVVSCAEETVYDGGSIVPGSKNSGGFHATRPPHLAGRCPCQKNARSQTTTKNNAPQNPAFPRALQKYAVVKKANAPRRNMLFVLLIIRSHLQLPDHGHPGVRGILIGPPSLARGKKKRPALMAVSGKLLHAIAECSARTCLTNSHAAVPGSGAKSGNLGMDKRR